MILQFQKLTLSDIPRVKPMLRVRDQACDNTVGGVFLWRDYFSTDFAIEDESLYFRAMYGGLRAYVTPQGPNPKDALDRLYSHCQSAEEPMILCNVTTPDLEILRERFDCTVSPERDWFDYLYSAEDLATLAGRRYSGQRNHINAFKRQFGDYSFETIDSQNLPDVLEFFGRFYEMEKKDSQVFREDRRKVREILEQFDTYGLPGGAIRAGGRIAAFAIGEFVEDTMYVHVEKADLSIRGAYQMIVNEFSAHCAAMGAKFINREDDSGDEGLRTSKQSYHPLRLVEKNTVIVQGKR